MKYLFSLSVVLFAVACSSTSPAPSPALSGKSGFSEVSRGVASVTDQDLIDAHMHIHHQKDVPYEVTVKNAINALKQTRVRGGIIHLGDEENTTFPFALLDENFAVCGGISPDTKLATIETGVKKRQLRCLKIYLGYVPKWAMDPFYKKFYQLALKYDIPVVFHTGDTYDKMASVKYADPLQIDEVAITYPKLKIVIAHVGNPWIHSAAEVIYKNDNVYADVSALLLGDVSKDVGPESVDELVVKPIRWLWLYVENPKKIMFGSDWPLLVIHPYAEAIARAIPKEHWRAVFYENARDVFKLKVN